MHPFRLYRKIERGEFFLVGGDCSQGGADSNFTSFLSKTNLDIPLVYKKQGVAAQMTADIHPVLEWIFDITGLQPVVAFERNNGGGSEMERLRVLNRNNKYRLYVMKRRGKTTGEEDTLELGYSTNTATRPILVGDYKQAVDEKLIKLYDKDQVDQIQSFIVNKSGKPEAAKNRHDDGVISPAICWQMYQTEEPMQMQNSGSRPVYQPRDPILGI